MTVLNKTTRNDRNRLAAAGVQKHITSPVVLEGVSRAPADLVAILTDAIGKADATAAAEGAYHQAVAAEKTSAALADATYLSLRGVVLNLFKGQPTVLADFGITEPVKKVPSAETKAAAVAKRAAKRAAKKAAPAPVATPAAKPTA